MDMPEITRDLIETFSPAAILVAFLLWFLFGGF